MNRTLGAGAALVVALAALAGCGDDSNSSDTLAPLPSGDEASVPSTPTTMPTEVTVSGTVDDPAGDLAAAIEVRVSDQPIAETVSLDLATVAADSVNETSLAASCTLITEPDAERQTIKIADFRRLQSGALVLYAELSFDGAEPGDETPATLTVGDAEQQSTSYEGTVVLADDARSGTFEVAEPTGATASGSFACAEPGPPSLPTTTAITMPPTTEAVSTSVAASPPPTAPAGGPTTTTA